MARADRRRAARAKGPLVLRIPVKATSDLAALSAAVEKALVDRNAYLQGVLSGMGVDVVPDGPWVYQVSDDFTTVTRLPRPKPPQPDPKVVPIEQARGKKAKR